MKYLGQTVDATDLTNKTFVEDAVAEGGGGASTLNDLTDVDTTGVTNDQVLAYNNGTWAPQTVSGVGGDVTSVNGETGVVVLSAEDVGAAPATHTHEISDVTDLQSTLDDKADSEHTHTATDITFSDESFSSTDVAGALAELFQYANDGKTAVADAIGSPASAGDTFETLAAYIDNAKTAIDDFIDSAEGTTNGTETLDQLTDKLALVRTFHSQTKLRKEVTSTETITLSKNITKEQLIITPLRLFNDDVITPSVFQADFNNGDQTDFETNSNLSFLNNRVEIPNNTNSANMTSISTETSGVIKNAIFNFSDLDDFSFYGVTNTTLSYFTLNGPQILKANGDISISNVSDFTAIEFVASPSTGTLPNSDVAIRYAISFDSGTTWHGYVHNSFSQFTDIDDTDEFATKGIPLTTFSTLGVTSNELAHLDTLRDGSSTIRLAYYIRKYLITNTVYLDTMTIQGKLTGELQPAGSSVTVTFNDETNVITCTFNIEDTYQLNWID
jgi:hypothetical protein